MASAKTVMIVDDEEAVRDAMSRHFKKQGYQVIAADGAESALEVMKGKSITVAFLDLEMPGMNGVELCREVKRRSPITCLVAVTGYSTLFGLSECREAGFEDYFTKPTEMQLLLDVAERACERLDRWKELK